MVHDIELSMHVADGHSKPHDHVGPYQEDDVGQASAVMNGMQGDLEARMLLELLVDD